MIKNGTEVLNVLNGRIGNVEGYVEGRYKVLVDNVIWYIPAIDLVEVHHDNGPSEDELWGAGY